MLLAYAKKIQNLDNLNPQFHLQENNYPTHIDYKMNQIQFFNQEKFQRDLSNHVQSKSYIDEVSDSNEPKKTYMWIRKGKPYHNHSSLTFLSHPKYRNTSTPTHKGNLQVEIQRNIKLSEKLNKSRIIINNFKSRSYETMRSSNYNSRTKLKLRLNKESKTLKSNLTCYYCCCKGHVFAECKLRKKNNMLNVVWVPKSCKN